MNAANVARGIAEILTDYEDGERSEPISDLISDAQKRDADFNEVNRILQEEASTDYGWTIGDLHTIVDTCREHGIYMHFNIIVG